MRVSPRVWSAVQIAGFALGVPLATLGPTPIERSIGILLFAGGYIAVILRLESK